jgi:hypothetical protein
VLQPNQVRFVADTAAGRECDPRRCPPDLREQRQVDAVAAPHAGEVENNDGPHTSSTGAKRDCLRRAGADCRGSDRLPVAEVETEGDQRLDRVTDLVQRVERRQRFEAHDDTGDAECRNVAGLLDRTDAGVDPQRNAAREQVLEVIALHGATSNRIEVRDIQLTHAEIDVPLCH